MFFVFVFFLCTDFCLFVCLFSFSVAQLLSAGNAAEPVVDEASVTGNMISFPIIINFTFPFPLMNHCLMKKGAKGSAVNMAPLEQTPDNSNGRLLARC